MELTVSGGDTMGKLVRWIFKTVLVLLLLVVVLFSILTFFQIPLDLTRFKEPVESIVSSKLGRPVRIEKSIVISTSLKPLFTLKGLRILNPEDFKNPDFLFMELAQIQVELLPLLEKKIHIPEIRVQGLDVTLEENDNGDVNWVLGKSSETVPAVKEPEQEDKPTAVSPEPSSQPPLRLESDTIVLEKLDLRDISVDYFDQREREPVQFKMDSCAGAMVPGKPLKLDIVGKLQAFDYKIDVSIASLEEFLRDNRSWVELTAGIAETELTMSGHVNLETAARSLALKTSVTGKNLASLNDLLQLDLPPFASYQLRTDLNLRPQTVEMKKLFVKTGASSLQGSARLEEEGEKTIVDLKLHSPMVQIDDFVFDDWSWTNEAPDADEIASDSKEELPRDNKKLFDPEILAKYDCSLLVESEEVLSGEDLLGSGRLNASLRDGRIRVNPLKVNLPGGEILISASLQPGFEQSDAELDVEMKNFDIGIYVRRSKPESEMGGLVNLDVYLRSSAASLAEMLENGTGYLDFSGKLENFGSGIIDLWAVNLVSALVSSTDGRQSQINCAVGRWSVENGILSSDAFFIDTSRIRICAEGKVDLKEKRIDLSALPRAKRAEFFSLATPVEVHGTFSDLNVGLGGGGVVGTAVKFIASPVSTPLKRMFSRKIPSDGRDVCDMVIGQGGRTEIFVPGCRRKPARGN